MKSGGRRFKIPRAAWIAALVVGMCGLFVVSVYFGMSYGGEEPSDIVAIPPAPEPNPAPIPPPEPEEPPPDERPRCPLDGTPVDPSAIERPVLAVVIDNHPAARPQDGLDFAGVVYEVPVEGGMTRFIALYLCRDVTLIGPVRSLRDYMIDIALGHGAVICHCGGSPAAYQLLGQIGTANLDDLKGGGGYWRVAHRRAPHNLYARTAALWDDAERRKYSSADLPGGGLTFADEPERDLPASEISVPFPGGGYRVTFLYEELTGAYLRFIGDTAHRDSATGLQLEATNVILQFVRSRVIPNDPEGRLAVTLAGEGRVMVCSGGEASEGRWVRPAGTYVTRYLDDEGQDIALAPGKTWILIVPSHGEVTVK